MARNAAGRESLWFKFGTGAWWSVTDCPSEGGQNARDRDRVPQGRGLVQAHKAIRRRLVRLV